MCVYPLVISIKALLYVVFVFRGSAIYAWMHVFSEQKITNEAFGLHTTGACDLTNNRRRYRVIVRDGHMNSNSRILSA